ncbi:hypothetical protein CC117_04805 [Parafrankia colletiae]|uniref:Uncharacterized protein n=1 Tax=Parafrankia colletiae TaxID=573497 RepID=A0A1S1QMZ1_9ACTN|nr:hypothetical protein [Parafrankia colletiae]MCK9900403.1 hypothetical protein [Frankia sp. Cpl3]OHV33704.1 hypothetical protein CC117_04805 [Parafrankia colletiae]
MLGDRLWDDAGREWRYAAGQWADVDEVERRLVDARVVLLHGFGRPLQWLTRDDTARRWEQMRHHFEVPGQYGARGDDQDLTYAAVVWRRGDEQLLGFESFC